MENKKELKKKRVPAPKTNTCIKWHHLGRTATALTLEELGLLYFMLQIVDDEKNIRYELIANDFTKELFSETEKNYIKLFDKKMRENPLFRNAFEEHAGQIKSSRNYYEALVKRIVEHNDLVDEMQGTATTETPKAKAKTETPEATETENEDETDEENIKYEIYEAKEPGTDDFRFTNEKQIDISDYAKDAINNNNEQTEAIIYFLYRNSKKYNNSDECNIDEVINDYKKEFALPFSVDD